MAKYLFTSESVTEGHPDKICDRISDGVLDAILAQDKNARVACETCATTGMVLILGEITTTANVDIPAIARDVIKETGYDNSDYGFDYKTCAILTTLDKQSPDIAMGVDNALEGRDNNEFDTGAGDQGMMFGYACDETKELMPLTISLAHALSKKLTAVRGLYFVFLKFSELIIALGRRSNTLLTAAEISLSGFTPVPNVSTKTDTGCATPIAYASSTSQRFAMPAATMFFATCLAA